MENKPIINGIKKVCDLLETLTDKEIKDTVVRDYHNLIDLRNRIKDSFDVAILYEEDHLTLDHILDYMEIFIKIIKEEL